MQHAHAKHIGLYMMVYNNNCFRDLIYSTGTGYPQRIPPIPEAFFTHTHTYTQFILGRLL
jgi:hypothetical protein